MAESITNDSPSQRAKVAESLLDKAYSGFQTDGERFWKMFNSMVVINGGLLFALSFSRNSTLSVILAILGIILCVCWRQMQLRYAGWCDRWDEMLTDLETQYVESAGVEIAHTVFRRRGENRAKDGWTTRRTPAHLATAIAVVWAVYGVISTVDSFYDQAGPSDDLKTLRHTYDIQNENIKQLELRVNLLTNENRALESEVAKLGRAPGAPTP